MAGYKGDIPLCSHFYLVHNLYAGSSWHGRI